MTEESIHLELFTKRSHDDFFEVKVFVNESGNVCVHFDENNFAVLTPKMAKRLSSQLDEANRQAIADHFAG